MHSQLHLPRRPDAQQDVSVAPRLWRLLAMLACGRRLAWLFAATTLPTVLVAQADEGGQGDAPAQRGLQLAQDPVSAFSGIRAPSPWIGMRIPKGDADARRASYPVEAGSFRVVPSVLVVPESGASVPGVVSLGLERAATGDPLRAKAQYEWSGKSGGSFEVDYRVDERQLSLRGNGRPGTFVSAVAGRLPGHALDGAWAERLGSHTTATLSLLENRVDLDGREPDAGRAQLVLRHRATDQWSLHAGVSRASYRDFGESSELSELRRGSVALGAAFEGGGLGVSATVRSEENSTAGRAGRGGRLSVQGAGGQWSARAYADLQQQASTLELNVPGILDPSGPTVDLGLLAANPEDVVRGLAEQGGVIRQQGFTVGALRVDPLRLQGGLEVAWRPSGPQRTEFGVRVAVDELDGLPAARRVYVGRLYGSWRLFGDVDFTANYANGLIRREFSADDDMTVIHLSVKRAL